jgi:hypothetical protein
MERRVSFLKLCLLLFFTFTSFNITSEVITSGPSPIESLSPELRQLLSQEMISLQTGMTAIIPAYVSGDWHKISDIALKMKHSYILKQTLTQSQKHEFHSNLPASFLKLDQQFHYQAGMLSHAADMKKPDPFMTNRNDQWLLINHN